MIFSLYIRCQKKLNCIPIHNVLTTEYLEKDGWEMMFRATAGNGDNAYTEWISGKHLFLSEENKR